MRGRSKRWLARVLVPVVVLPAVVGLAPKDASAAPGDPFGSLDLVEVGVGRIRVGGWALDPDTWDPIPVHVYVDSNATGLSADGYRPDVGAAYGLGDYHGFDGYVPASSGWHNVCVYAINTAGAGGNMQLRCEWVYVSGEPFGAIDLVSGTADGVRVAGWALDPDTTGPAQVHVYVNDLGTAITADGYRPDVNAVHPGVGEYHGYDAVVPAGAPGPKNVCLYAINVAGEGSNQPLGCRNVNVAYAPSAPTNLTIRPDSERLHISWRPPASTGGSAIVSYTIVVRDVGSNAEAAREVVPGYNLSTVASGLVNGRSYYATVFATNEVGDGASTTSAAVMPFAWAGGTGLLGDHNPVFVMPFCRTPWGVNCTTGNFSQAYTDLAIPGRGAELAFVRTYNSQANLIDGPLGWGWTHSYNMRLVVYPGSSADITQENGSTAFFKQHGNEFRADSHVYATLVQNGDGTFSFFRKHDLLTFVFASTGQLLRVVDANDYPTTLSYVGGRLDKVTDAGGRFLSFSYRPDNRLERVSDSAGRSVQFGYDSSARNDAVTDVNQKVTRFAYDEENHLVSITDPRGQTLSQAFDCESLCQVGPDRKFSYSYVDGPAPGRSDLTVTFTDPKGHTTIARNESNRLASITTGVGTPEEATTGYTYDPVTMGIASVTDPENHTWTATFDTSGNRTSLKDPLQREWKATYTAQNRVATLTDPASVKTTFTYDAKANLTSESTPLVGTSQNATTVYGYDPARSGDLVSVIDPTSRVWRYAHDTVGNRIRSEDPAGNATTFGYDAAGRMAWSVAPRGNVAGAPANSYKTTYTHNPSGDLTSRTDPLNRLEEWSYDANRNLETYKDGNSHTTRFEFNPYNERTAVIRPDLTVQRTGYDDNGNVATQTDPLGRVTTYTHDPLNRLASVRDPLNRVTTFRYDRAGNLKVATDPSMRTQTATYDAADQLTSVDYSDPATPDVSFTYSPLGVRKTMADGTGTSQYSWDSLGRLTSHTNGAGRTVAYDHDLAGRLTTIDYPALPGVPAGRVTRAYDGAGRLASVKDWGNRQHSFSYDANDNLVTHQYPNGTTGTSTFDAADQLTAVVHKKTGKTLSSFAYTLDGAGLVTAENTSAYGHDANDRLLSAAHSPGFIYTYDAADNPKTLRSGTLTSTLGVDPAAQLTSLSRSDGQSFTFTYDNQGNRTAKKTAGGATVASYAYDQANRLRSVGATSYSYDGDGLRTAKTGAGATAHVWDLAEGLPLMLADGTTRYVTGPGGLPVHEVTAGGVASYYHADRLGSTRAMTNSSGSVVATYAYDPYGNITSTTGTATTPFKYAGQYTDAESGLQYLRARFYDPSTAQFLSRDPIEPLTRQPYSYADNSPVNGSDPTGLQDCRVGQQAGAGAAARVNVPAAAGAPAVGQQCKSGGIDMHHAVPKEILKKLPPDVANNPAVRGRAGAPNRWPLPRWLHKRVHGKGGGPKYNTAWKAELASLGGPPTVDDVLAIRDMLAKRFGFWHCKP